MKRSVGSAVLLASLVALSACGADRSPEVTPAPTIEPTTETAAEVEGTEEETESAEAPVVEETPEATVGDRTAPLAVGESRKLSNESAWTVSLQSSNLDAAADILAADEWAERPADGEVFVVGTFTVTVDGSALEAQGFDLANEGAEVWANLSIEFVGADGRGFDGLSGTMCYTQDMLYEQGTLYEDGASVTGDVCIAVPSEHVEGGLWRVSNMVNDSVWIDAA